MIRKILPSVGEVRITRLVIKSDGIVTINSM